MDFFNSERALQLHETIAFWNRIILDIGQRRKTVKAHQSKSLDELQARFSAREEKINEEMAGLNSDLPRVYQEERLKFSREMTELMRASIEDVSRTALEILDEEAKMARSSLSEQLDKVNLIFDVGEIDMEQHISDTIKFLIDAGYTKNEATSVATKMFEDSAGSSPGTAGFLFSIFKRVVSPCIYSR